MRLEIDDILGVRRCAVELKPGDAVEVIGPNASGKTSVATAAQAVLANTPNPLGLPVADFKHYVHAAGEADNASARFTDGVEVVWRPAAQTITAPPDHRFCQPAAVGLVDFTVKRSARDTAELFQGLLLPPPQQVIDAVTEALEQYLDSDVLAGVVEMLMRRDRDGVTDPENWNETEKTFRGRALEAKRSWCKTTGQTRYGVKVAADWHPDLWMSDYDYTTVQQAEEAVVEARDALALLHRAQAVTEAEAEIAAEAKQRIPGLEQKIVDLETKLLDAAGDSAEADQQVVAVSRRRREAGANREAAQKKVTRLHQQPPECPHCKGALRVTSRGDVVVGVVISDDAKQNAVEDLDACAEALETAIQQLVDVTTVLRKRRATEARLRQKLGAEQQELKQNERSSALTGPTQTAADIAALAEGEQTVEDRKQVAAMIKARYEAHQLHETIVNYTAIGDAVGPQGVRTRLLEVGLGRLNKGLGLLAAETGWSVVTVNERGNIYWGDRPVRLCSESERWRTQTCLQLTLAALTESAVVVLDRADLLDTVNRRGLIRAVRRVASRTGIAVMVCATEEHVGSIVEWDRTEIKQGETQ